MGLTPACATTPSRLTAQESRTYPRQLEDSKSPTQPKREGKTGESERTAIASGAASTGRSLLALVEMKTTAEGKSLPGWVYLTDPRAGPQCDPLLNHSQSSRLDENPLFTACFCSKCCPGLFLAKGKGGDKGDQRL